MAPRTKKEQVLEKSEAVTISPPGHGPRFALLGGKNVVNDIALYEKKGQYGIFYEMYRQHPVVRAAIDKKATYASLGGFKFVSSRPNETLQVDKSKERDLREFFKVSQYRKLLRLTFKDMSVYGESFWVVILSLSGRPMKAMRLNPRYMYPVISGGVVTAWKYGPVAQDQNAIRYPAELILHFMVEDPESDVQGMSPLYALQRAVAQDIQAMEYNENFFTNAAQTGTIFVAKTADEGEAKRAREWIEANYTGSQNAHRPLFIEGDVSVEKSVSTRVEMEFLEGRKLLREEIGMVLGVDLEKLGIKAGANRATSKQQDDSFHTETIRAEQVVVEDEINFTLIEMLFGWDDIIVMHSEADPGHRREQVEIWNEEQKMGRMSINDILAEQGKPPRTEAGADIVMIHGPAGVLPVDIIVKIAEMQLVADPVSGVGTDSTGQRNPETGSMRTKNTPSQAEDSKLGDK